MKNIKIYFLALGHLCADLNQGALSALLPYIIATYFYSYAKASSLVLIANLIGSIVQPLVGHLADRKHLPWLLPTGLLLAGGGMALTGFSSDYLILALGVLISGFGVAIFHPQAARSLNTLSDANNRGRHLAIFAFGGNLGFSIGPLLTALIIGRWGLKGSLFFLLPQLFYCFFYKLLYKEESMQKGTVASKTSQQIDNWPSFFKLCILVFNRSIILYGLNTFLALYLIKHFDLSKDQANVTLSLFFALSALSTLLGGHLSDKLGRIFIIKIAFLSLSVGLITFSLSTSIWLSLLLLIPIALGLAFCYSPMIVLGQTYLPNHIGLASGVTLGLALSIGGLFVPLLGSIADHYGLVTSMRCLALISIISLFATTRLDQERK